MSSTNTPPIDHDTLENHLNNLYSTSRDYEFDKMDEYGHVKL